MKFLMVLLFSTIFLLMLIDPSVAWLRKGYPSTEPANAYLNAEYFSNVTSLPSPLILTPYIEAGKLDEGRKLSAVKNLPGGAPNIVSYSGFLTVSKEHNSNLFFWFFPPLVCTLLFLVIVFLYLHYFVVFSEWQSRSQHASVAVVARRSRCNKFVWTFY